IVYALSEEWHHYCEGSQEPLIVYTDHSNLRDFCTTKKLNRREARWSQTLQNYNFKIVYRPGPKNEKADALTRRSGDLPEGKEDERSGVMGQLLQNKNFDSKTLLAAQPKTKSIEERIRTTLLNDELGKSVIKVLANKDQKHRTIPLSETAYKDGLLWVKERLYVPDDEVLQADIIRTRHDIPAVGHPGRTKTFDLLSREYWWPRMHRTVERYMKNCEICQRAKPTRNQPYGLLKPLQ